MRIGWFNTSLTTDILQVNYHTAQVALECKCNPIICFHENTYRKAMSNPRVHGNENYATGWLSQLESAVYVNT